MPIIRPDKAAPAQSDQKKTEEGQTIQEPAPNKDVDADADSRDKPPRDEEPAKAETAPPPASHVVKENAALLAACLGALAKSGAQFNPIEPLADVGGCGIEKPVRLDALPGGIALEPPANLRCKTALALVEWMGETVVPMMSRARPGARIVAIDQASSYVCRKRNSAETGKISEHARGNAVDIAGFRLEDGSHFTIEPRQKNSTLDGAFQRGIAAAACLYFTTVLDPASDKAHETHLHLDVIARKNGYRYCW